MNLPQEEGLKTGVYWQEVINDKGEAVASSGKNLYICWGLFEDLVLNFEFGFGEKYKDIISNDIGKGSGFDSSQTFCRFDPYLFQKQLFNDTATNQVVLYGDNWNHGHTYNTIRGKSPDRDGHPGEGSSWTQYDKNLNQIPLREIFVRVDTIKSAFKRASKLSEVIRDVFSSIKRDTYEILDFDMISTDYNYTSIQCIDKNYLAKVHGKQYTEEWFRDLFEFLPHGPKSIVNNFNIKLNTPSGEMQSMIAINAMSPGNQIFPVSSKIDRYLAVKTATSYDDEERGFTHLPSLGNFRGQKFGQMTNLDAIINMNYADSDNILNNTDEHTIFLESFSGVKNRKVLGKINKAAEDADSDEMEHILDKNYNGENYNDNDDADGDDTSTFNGKVASSISEYFGTLAKQNFWVTACQTTLPIEGEVTLYGISEINPGDLFRIRFMPKIYREKIYFQITKVSHTLDSTGWYTRLETVMRFRHDKKFVTGGNYQNTNNIFLSTGLLDKYKHLSDNDITFKLSTYKKNIRKFKLAVNQSQQSILSFKFNTRGKHYKPIKEQENNVQIFDTSGTSEIAEYYYGSASVTDKLIWSTPFSYGDPKGINEYQVDDIENWIIGLIGNNIKHFGWGESATIDDILYFDRGAGSSRASHNISSYSGGGRGTAASRSLGFAWRPIRMDISSTQEYFICTFGKTQWLIVPIVGGGQDLNKVLDIWMQIVTYSNRSIWPHQGYLPAYMANYYEGGSGRLVKPECIAANCGDCGVGWSNVCGAMECLHRGNDGGEDGYNYIGGNSNLMVGSAYKSYCMFEDNNLVPGVTCKMNPYTCYYEVGGGPLGSGDYSLPEHSYNDQGLM